MGYIFIQEPGEKEMIRLACGPETLLLSLISQAKTRLGLSSNTSSTPSTPSSPSPFNPMSNPNNNNRPNLFLQSSPRIIIPNNGFHMNPSSSPSSPWSVSGFSVTLFLTLCWLSLANRPPRYRIQTLDFLTHKFKHENLRQNAQRHSLRNRSEPSTHCCRCEEKYGNKLKATTSRHRWFVLKQGKLLWFKDSSVTRASFPRGVLSVATCLTVKGAEDVLNKPFAFELSTDRFTESCGCQEGQPGGVDEIRSDQIDVIVRSEKWQIASVENGRFVGLHCSLVDPD